jgi:branched-chain amino acid transport system ATP-binding protein
MTAATHESLLELAGVRAGYGTSEVLFGIDLALARGEIVGVLGRNGMGKTTIVRSIMGIVRPTGGRVALAGREIAGVAPHRVARLGVALVPEGRQVFPNLTVDEHLGAFHRAGPEGAAAWSPTRVLDMFPALASRRRHFGDQLSGGEQQMLAIGRALVTNPLLLILDEATEGLAPLVREEIWRSLATLRGAGLAMIVIDKYVDRLVAIGDHHVIVEKGRVAWRGSSAALHADRSLWQRHLGA